MGKRSTQYKAGFRIAAIGFCVAYALMVCVKSLHSDPVGEDDMRHLMTGVFYRDLVLDFPVENLRSYALEYYVQYPVLGVLHWPPVFHLIEALFFLVFGIHTEIPRLLLIGFVLAGGYYLGKIVELLGGDKLSEFCAMVIFSTFPIVHLYGQKVMLEVPSLTFGIVSTYFFLRFLKTESNSNLYISAILAVLSVLTKGGTVFLVGLFALLGFYKMRWMIFRKPHLWVGIVGFLGVCLSYNAMVARFNGVRSLELFGYWEMGYLEAYLSFVWSNFGLLAVVGSGVALILSMVSRKWMISLFLGLAIGLPFLMVVRVSFPLDRYLINMAMGVGIALCLLPSIAPKRYRKFAQGYLILCALWLSGNAIASQVPVHYGYDRVARFLIENPKGDSVAIHSAHPGNLMFYLRKLDPQSELFVLPSSKYFSYESPDEVVRMLVDDENQVYDLMDSYGVGYFLFEVNEKNFKRQPLHDLLSEMLREDGRFVKVASFPIVDNSRGGSELEVFRVHGDGRIKRPTFDLKMGRLAEGELSIPVPARRQDNSDR